MLTVEKSTTVKYVTGKSIDLGLYKYNIISDQWILLLQYPKEFTSSDHSICCDQNDQVIYLYDTSGQRVTIDLKKLTFEISKITPAIGKDSQLLMINNECHSILGDDCDSHYKWNSKLQKLDKLFQFKHIMQGLSEHGVVYMKSKNKLLLFGGWDDGTEELTNDIWECDLNNEDNGMEWTKLKDIKLPMEMSNFAWILSKDERYLIIFGGENTNLDRLRSIFILDLKEMKMYQAKVKLYDRGIIDAIVMSNDKNSILVGGVTREMAREYDINIPIEMGQLIFEYYDSEIIYLFTPGDGYRSSNIALSIIELSDILKEKTDDLTLHFFE